jgi:hypothetical protein
MLCVGPTLRLSSDTIGCGANADALGLPMDSRAAGDASRHAREASVILGTEPLDLGADDDALAMTNQRAGTVSARRRRAACLESEPPFSWAIQPNSAQILACAGSRQSLAHLGIAQNCLGIP